jgi:ferredoxin-NADP reductase
MNAESSTSAARADVHLILRVDAMHRCATDVVSLDLGEPHSGLLPGWAPGAHVDVSVAGGLVRQYSLCGDPAQQDRWRIAVLREPDSRGGSRFLHDCVRPGDELRVRGPRNNFALVPADMYLFIAGGIGITPILPMVRQVAGSGRRWTLLARGQARRSRLRRAAGVCDLPTAFLARAGSGPLHIGICAEYDALPGLGHA